MASVSGYLLLWKKYRKTSLVGFALTLGIVSLVLGVGITSHWSAPIIEWGYAHLPLFSGFREPQKWIGILMYVLLFGCMTLLFFIKKLLDHHPLKILSVVLVALVMLV